MCNQQSRNMGMQHGHCSRFITYIQDDKLYVTALAGTWTEPNYRTCMYVYTRMKQFYGKFLRYLEISRNLCDLWLSRTWNISFQCRQQILRLDSMSPSFTKHENEFRSTVGHSDLDNIGVSSCVCSSPLFLNNASVWSGNLLEQRDNQNRIIIKQKSIEIFRDSFPPLAM